MRTAQMWSTDVLLGVTIFIGGIALFYGSMHLTGQTDYPMLKEEAKIATHRLLKPDSSINILTPEKEVNVSRLEDLSNMEYGALRDALGIRGEYCVYLEDKYGRMITIANKSGLGNNKLNLSGTPCGELV